MNPPALAARLHELAQQLEKQSSRLQGVALGKSVNTLHKQLDSFEKKLQAAVGGHGPGVQELGLLLKANAKLLTLSALRAIAKDVFGADAPKAAKAPLLKKAILQEAARRHRGEVAVKVVRAFLEKANTPKTSLPKEEAALLREFLRLGGLDDEAFKREMSGRWKKVSDLKRLAKANKLPGAKSLAKADLIREIKKVSRRAHANVAD